MVTAVLWDFGGVVTSSPFEAFARYEAELGAPVGFIRGLNATNPDTNAWARLERSEVNVEEFCTLFEAEAAAAGFALQGRRVLEALDGYVRPAMAEAVRRCGERLAVGCITNNIARESPALNEGRAAQVAEVMGRFHVVVESSKVGVRKPDPRIYRMACEALSVEPSSCVYLDDLGINLKPARALGMTTIKVTDPDEALDALEAAVGFAVR